jgi:hypothetical protein
LLYMSSVLTWTYTHQDSPRFCPCNLRSEGIINLVTAVLCVLCYYSASKRFLFHHLATFCFTLVMLNYLLYWTVSDQ